MDWLNDPLGLVQQMKPEMPVRRMFGFSEVWRDNSTGTRDFYLFFVRVCRNHFTHSTGWFD